MPCPFGFSLCGQRSMSTVVIHGEGLGKSYHRGALQQSTLLRDHLSRMLKSPLSVFRRPKDETFWALEDVSLEVREGEVLGLIGRNGAGKTTLLKILSRITKPTTGWAEIHGRVGSLLEVGTGFHPELTGRENTFLSGAILGMSKREITRKFDEIVAFAELEKFIDTPVKHYSSGMYVRLAFAVAAHLEPEILLVDEVLAVGDINFQKKCLGKMGDVARAGRTVVLVSHQLNQIRRLCHRTLWIDGGMIREAGPTADVVGAYEANARASETNNDIRTNECRAQFLRWEILGARKDQPNVLDWDGEVRLKFVVRVNESLSNIHHGIALYNRSREVVWGNAVEGLSLEPGVHEMICTLPSLPLRPGVYTWRVSFYDKGERIDDWDCLPPMFVSTQPRTHKQDAYAGVLNIPSEFANQRLQN
jgi:lipopolysaccharide transport system ATP-binding protein